MTLSPTTEPRGQFASRIATSIDDVPVSVLTFDGDSLVAVNRHWSELTGLTITESTGSGWLTAVHSDDWMTARRFIHAAGVSEAIAEWRVLGVEGRDSVWVQATSGRVNGSEGGSFVIALTEIDAHKANEAGLLHRALHDPLTGLLNHSAFMTRVEDALEVATTERGSCAVLYLDLDHFKDINDEFGHTCGDNLLAAVSRRIRASLRPTDTVARLGGDEIAVLCPALESDEEAIRLAERVVATIGQPFTIDERMVHSSVSIGVAFSSEGASTARELVQRADRAMYRAKAAGRAQWATMTRGGATPRIEPVDAKDVLALVVQAHDQLHQFLTRLDFGDGSFDRLAQASHALTRAAHLLEGDSRIG